MRKRITHNINLESKESRIERFNQFTKEFEI